MQYAPAFRAGRIFQIRRPLSRLAVPVGLFQTIFTLRQAAG